MKAYLGDLWHFPFLVEIWGTASSWAGATITGFSFLLAANVYRRNSRDQRISQASKVVFTANFAEDFDEDRITRVKGTVFNHSDAMIMHVAVVVRLKEEVLKKRTTRTQRLFDIVPGLIQHVSVVNDEHMNNVIEPGESESYEADIPNWYKGPRESVEAFLQFTDANSVVWERPLNKTPNEFVFDGLRERWSRAAIRTWRRMKAKALPPKKRRAQVRASKD